MATVTSTKTFSWQTDSIFLSASEVNFLFEIFGPFPVHNEYTLTAGIMGMGKSRTIVANQDQLRDALFHYLELLSNVQSERVQQLISRWIAIDTKIVKFSKAEHVDFRTSAPQEERDLIRNRIQTYIPIFRADEVNDVLTGILGHGDNTILRG